MVLLILFALLLRFGKLLIVANYSDVLDILRDELLYTEKETCQNLIDVLIHTISRKEHYLAGRVFIAAAGRSKMVANMFAMRMMHCGLNVQVVGETTTTQITRFDSLLLVSGSGETKQLINFAEKAKSVRSEVLLVTASSTSTLRNMADEVFQIGPSSRVLSTSKNLLPLGSRFELATMIFFETVILNFMEQLKLTEDNLRDCHTNLE
jgi:6-phospho-3-hexuloisomerase/3-hexulose-6-phosphate synthase/6-phospho-3-hexuloisomerase